MPRSNDILQELTELNSGLPQDTATDLYAVPASYFESLADQILIRVKALDAATATEEISLLSPILSSIRNINPYSIPADYFSSLDSSSVLQSPEEELAGLSTLLSGMKKENVYHTPVGYFDTLTPSVRKAAPAKVVTMKFQNWKRYAAAAIVAGLVAVSGLIYFNGNKTEPAVDSFAWIEKNLKKVSTEDLDSFVRTTTEEPALAKVEAPDEVKKLMKDVSDKDIQDFLKDTPIDEADNDDLLLN